ncbi:trypsin-like peptidase domain-containing protein [Candidatus Bathyarchaeota archaeon]|nr:trypsin-like peptidase domain-containing protein [Candidatus Bathyarchaeota archaeon]
MDFVQKPNGKNLSTILIVMIVLISLVSGGLLGYLAGYLTFSNKINDLNSQLSDLQTQVANLQLTQTIISQNNTYILGENASLSELYEKVKESVVVVRGVIVQYDIFHRAHYTQVQGSGFVYNHTGQMVIITNYHVIEDAINITVTFIDGDGYAATVLGYDPYADLAVLSTTAPQSELKPLEIISSSTLEVGDIVVAVGNPYGLAGSMSIGIVSALGRTITEEETGGYPIADIIQTTTPLNPGNSGGPLLNLQGQVIGITTAIISDSQGLGFAIPSNTILREISLLITYGYYDQHPWLGISGVDMTYEIAQAMNTNVTYGVLITQVISDSPADKAGLKGGTQTVLVSGEYVTIGGDVITAINGTKITSTDELSAYLEEHTAPGQTITLTIVRSNQAVNVSVELEKRP